MIAPNLRRSRPLWPALLLAALSWPALAAVPDVRVLIDVSGSMKKNDPQLLRAEGLRLLVELLPAEARAGIWTFGRYVTPEVAVAPADEPWKAQARQGADRIHARSQNTDIEQALSRALAGWEGADAEVSRHLILLTDGMVDLAAGAAQSAASRQRILTELLPRIAGLGARVHTIALSGEADHELMRELARSSDGWYQQVDGPEALQRTFLRMFEKAAPRDALPLVDNVFLVDRSIAEMTVVVFRAKDQPPVEITTPDGTTLSAASAAEGWRWRQGQGYELITVAQPPVGEWRIGGMLDPDNRVLVVTDLQLVGGELPNHLAPAAHPRLSAWLSDQTRPVTDAAFLDLVKFSLEHLGPDGARVRRELSRQQGRYQVTLLDELSEGVHEFLWRADSPTFMRSLRQTVQVRWPVEVFTRPQAELPDSHAFSIQPRPDMIEPATLRVAARLRDPRGQMLELDPYADEDWAWQGQTGLLDLPGRYHLYLEISATSTAGKALRLAMQPIAIDGPRAEPAAAAAEPQVIAALVEEEPAPEGLDWPLLLGAIVLINLVLGGLGLLVYRRWRNQLERPALRLVEEG